MTITATERDLGDGRVLVTSTDVEEERSSQAIHQTCADGARLIRCVYDGDLDRIALLDPKLGKRFLRQHQPRRIPDLRDFERQHLATR